MANHPHEIWQKQKFGAYHVSQGRRLPVHNAALASPEEQEHNLRRFVEKEPGRLINNRPFEPVRHVLEGARAYNHNVGLADPHAQSYDHIKTNVDNVKKIGRAYDSLPLYDKHAEPHFAAMGHEVKQQYDHLTGRMGIHVEPVDFDPYKDVHEMTADVRNNKRLRVMKTAVTGAHPYFSDEENDRFRAVHDAFGHAATGRGFDAHGEEAAFLAHSKMFSHHALPAMTSETRGQNASLHLNGDFGDQRVALLPPHMYDIAHDLSQYKTGAVDWNEYRNLQDAQNRRYERPGIGGGQAEYDQYFGKGEYAGSGVEHRITPKEWMQWSRQPRFEDLPQHEQEWHRGYELGQSHGQNADHADFGSMDREHGRSSHPEHFYNGYVEGLHSGVENGARIGRARRQDYVDDEGFTPMYHGTRQSFQPGDVIEPGHQKTDGMTRDGYVYFSHHPGNAARYSRRGRVYQVKPTEEYGDDPGSMNSYRSKGPLQVVGEVPLDRARQIKPPVSVDHRPSYVGMDEDYRKHSDHFDDMWYGASRSSRVAVLHGWSGPGSNRLARQIAEDMPSIVRMAHDSGDAEVVFHCFAGETRYITRDGVKTFAETVGTTQWVLTGSMDDPHGGFWVEAPIRELGVQKLWEITLHRNRRTKVIRATSGHRWLIRRPDRVVTTQDLKPGQRLAHLRAKQFDIVPDAHGIRMGFVFGDGTVLHRGNRTHGAVTLWGKKRVLAKYFDEVATQAYEVRTDRGVPGLRYTSGMAGYTKVLPALTETPEYLRGWLMGYFAADGHVSRIGQISLSSSSLENLERVRDIATVLGIGAYAPRTQMRKGFGEEDTPLHSLDFVAEDLSPDFFIRDDQRSRLKADGKPARLGWTVESVRETEAEESVYCARVHGTDSFVLEDNIHTGNCPFCGSGQVIARNDGTIECQFCQACFTVQVQPQYPAFPQTINGQPVNVPGMGPEFPGMEPPEGDPGQPVPSDTDQDADGIPDAEEGPPGDDQEADDGGDDGGNPFAKKKKAAMLYRTANGDWLDEDQYMRHLALLHANDRQRVLARIRMENELG